MNKEEMDRELMKLQGLSHDHLLRIQEELREQYRKMGPLTWLVNKLEALEFKLRFTPKEPTP